MIFPPKSDKHARLEAARKLMMHCMNSSEKRCAINRVRRNIYLFGTASGEDCRVNKVKPICRRLSSFLYSPDQISFWAELQPDQYNQQTFEWLEAVSDTMNDTWHETGADELVGQGVEWSIVKGSMIGYASPRKMTDGTNVICPYMIPPENFGVWNESIPQIERQEAVCFRTYKSRPEIWRMLREMPAKEMPAKEREEIMRFLEHAPSDPGVASNVFPSSLTALTTDTSTITGIAPEFPAGRDNYCPDNPGTLYAIYTVYAWDDVVGDFNVFTFTADHMISDRPLAEESVEGIIPFVKFCSDELPDYYWGSSPVDDLAPLQDWNSDRLSKLDHLFGLVLEPPMSVTGAVGGLTEEKTGQFRKARGMMGLMVGGDVKQFAPELPNEAFMMMEAIEQMFIESAGMRPSMFGKPEPGVRTEGMAASYLRLSGSEVRKRALVIERQIEQFITLIYRLKQKYESHKILAGNGDTFRLADFPDDARIRVDGHSGSPLFIEDHAMMAQALMRYQAIDQRTLIDLLQVPFKSLMKYRLKDRFFANMVAEQQHKLQQQDKRTGKEK